MYTSCLFFVYAFLVFMFLRYLFVIGQDILALSGRLWSSHCALYESAQYPVNGELRFLFLAIYLI